MGYFIYSGDVEKLEGRKPFRAGECVALVQETTSVGHTSRWRPGPRVLDLHHLNPGTVIANFVFDKSGKGRFPNGHGYHAALFMGFGGRGQTTGKPMSIEMMDQWVRRRPQDVVKSRHVWARGRSHAEGNSHHDSDNADQFYVVVHE